MKLIFTVVSILATTLFSTAQTQGSFKFKYYEVYKVKSFDTLYRWEGGRKRNTFEQAGTVVFNERSKYVKFRLSQDNYEDKHTIFKTTDSYYQLTSGWLAFKPRQDENGNFLAVYQPKGTLWVVYYDYPKLAIDVE